MAGQPGGDPLDQTITLRELLRELFEVTVRAAHSRPLTFSEGIEHRGLRQFVGNLLEAHGVSDEVIAETCQDWFASRAD